MSGRRFVTISDLPEQHQARVQKQFDAAVQRPLTSKLEKHIAAFGNKPNKYHAQKVVTADGSKFDSKHERAVYQSLCAQYGKGSVIRQVSLPIGSKRIRPDFMVIVGTHSLDGRFTAFFADAKGMMTPAWSAKANHLNDAHGLKIKLF